MDNFFIDILEEHGIKYEVRGSEVWYQCPIPGHNNADTNYSASYSIPKNKCNCFVHGGGLATLLMYLTNGTFQEVKEILKKNKTQIDLNQAEYEIETILEQHTAETISESLIRKYRKLIHKSYTFENFTSSIPLIKQLEIGFDAESKRVTIPVRDRNGDPVLVVKRSIVPNAKLRYIYEPENCEKSNYVYGIDFWKDPEYLIVVEGVKDVIKCMDKGIKNVVAILGSKPSLAQIEILAKKTSKLYIALDDDIAGRKGTNTFKRHWQKFAIGGLLFFKHPELTMEEVKKKKRRDMADFTKEEIDTGMQNASGYTEGFIHVQQK